MDDQPRGAGKPSRWRVPIEPNAVMNAPRRTGRRFRIAVRNSQETGGVNLEEKEQSLKSVSNDPRRVSLLPLYVHSGTFPHRRHC